MKYTTLIVMTILVGAVALGGLGNQVVTDQRELERLRAQTLTLVRQQDEMQQDLQEAQATHLALQRERDMLAARVQHLEGESLQLQRALEAAQAQAADALDQVHQLQTAEGLPAVRALPLGPTGGRRATELAMMGLGALVVGGLAVVRGLRRRMQTPKTLRTANHDIWVRMTREQAQRYARGQRRQRP